MKARLLAFIILFSTLLFSTLIWAAVLGTVRGVVHDPDHRPVQGAQVLFKSRTSDYSQTITTDAAGQFETSTLPVGAYTITVTKDGFAASAQEIVVASSTTPV